jgi:hypothetical protein
MLRGLDAIPHLQRAIEIDPDFAMAHALLARLSQYRTIDGGRPISQRAFELRDRVSERERLFHLVALPRGYGASLGQSSN